MSGNLSRRDALRGDLETREGAERRGVPRRDQGGRDRVVAEAAAERGIEVVFADNAVKTLEGEPDLDEALRGLADAAAREPAAAR